MSTQVPDFQFHVDLAGVRVLVRDQQGKLARLEGRLNEVEGRLNRQAGELADARGRLAELAQSAIRPLAPQLRVRSGGLFARLRRWLAGSAGLALLLGAGVGEAAQCGDPARKVDCPAQCGAGEQADQTQACAHYSEAQYKQTGNGCLRYETVCWCKAVCAPPPKKLSHGPTALAVRS